MRCTKCGFISFDFNRVCPKCNRELGDEQRKLNLPSFRPEPPQLLGRLVGEAFDSEVEIRPEHDVSLVGSMADQEIDSDIEASFIDLEEGSYPYEGEEDHDIVSLEPDELVASPFSEENEADLSLDLEDIPFEAPEGAANATIRTEEELDLFIDDDLFEGNRGKESPTYQEPSTADATTGKNNAAEEEKGPSFNLDDISFDDLDLEMPQVLESKVVAEDISLSDGLSSSEPAAIENLSLENNPEGLTREIDMKKFRKDLQKRGCQGKIGD